MRYIQRNIDGGENMPKKTRIDMAGQRYERLIALSYEDRDRSGHALWRFACDCGSEVIVVGKNVRTGVTSSCGCLHREISAARLLEHGHRAAKRHEATYRAWQQMRQTRAAKICDRWASFESFLEDLGERPPATKLIRVDVLLPFDSANCRWAAVENRGTRAAAGWVKRRSKTAPAAIPAIDGSQGRPSSSKVAVTGSLITL